MFQHKLEPQFYVDFEWPSHVLSNFMHQNEILKLRVFFFNLYNENSFFFLIIALAHGIYY